MSASGTLLKAFFSLIFYGKIRPDFVCERIFIAFILVYPLKLKEKKASIRFVLESCAGMRSPPQFSKGQLRLILLLKYRAFK